MAAWELGSGAGQRLPHSPALRREHELLLQSGGQLGVSVVALSGEWAWMFKG